MALEDEQLMQNIIRTRRRMEEATSEFDYCKQQVEQARINKANAVAEYKAARDAFAAWMAANPVTAP